jgi:hypothetical protein
VASRWRASVYAAPLQCEHPHRRPAAPGDLGQTLRVVPARAQQTDMMAWSVFGAGAKITVRRGELILRTLSPIPALYRGLQLHPDDQEDPYVFRIDLFKYGLGTVRVVFSCDPSGTATGVHIDGLLLSAEKHPGRRMDGRTRRGGHDPYDGHRTVADERH